MLGNDYKDKILGVDILDWEALKNRYVSANKEMADNTDLIDGLNQKIDIWDKEKEQWSSLTQSVKDNANKQAAVQQFGADWQKQINEGRFAAYDDFKNRYLSIENQINDNTQLINSYNEKIAYYENLKSQWSVIADVYEQSVEDQYAAMLLGQQWESDVLSGRIDTLNSFKSNYMSIQQAIADAAWNSANAQIEAAKEAEKASAGTTGSAGNVSNGSNNSGFSNTETTVPEQKQKFNVKDAVTGRVYFTGTRNQCENYCPSHNLTILAWAGINLMVRSNSKIYPSTVNKSSAAGGGVMTQMKYASGTDNAKKGINLVGENGTETFIDNDGNVSFVTKPALIPMEGGETVLKASETEKILANTGNLIPLDGITFGKGENAVHFTQDELMRRWEEVMPSFSSMVQVPNFQMPKCDFVVTRNETTPVVQNVNLTLPNVTNDSGYERIKKELRQMQIDAYQFAHRR